MSTVTKNASIGTTDSAPFNLNNGMILSTEDMTAAEAIAVMDACMITSSGVLRCDGGIAGWDGFAEQAYASGDPVTLLSNGVIIEYTAADGMTVGDLLYRGDNGILQTVQVGTDPAIAKVIEDNKILVINAGLENAS